VFYSHLKKRAKNTRERKEKRGEEDTGKGQREKGAAKYQKMPFYHPLFSPFLNA